MPYDPPTDHESRTYRDMTAASRTLHRENPRLLSPGPAPTRTFGSLLGILLVVTIAIIIRFLP